MKAALFALLAVASLQASAQTFQVYTWPGNSQTQLTYLAYPISARGVSVSVHGCAAQVTQAFVVSEVGYGYLQNAYNNGRQSAWVTPSGLNRTFRAVQFSLYNPYGGWCTFDVNGHYDVVPYQTGRDE